MVERGAQRIAVVVAAALLGAGPAAARPLSLGDALAIALEHNLELQASEAEADGARARSRAALGALGPRLHVDANLYEWNSPFSISIGGMPFLVRQDLTSLVTVSGTQPLTGLWPGALRYRGRRDEREAAVADVDAARADLRLRTTAAFLGLAEAGDVMEIAARAVADAEEQAARARALAANGRLLDADRLRTEVAVAQAKQDLLAAEGARASGRAALAAILGLPVDGELEVERVDVTRLPALPGTVRELLAMGERGRPEIRAARSRASAGRAGAQAAVGELLPAIDVTGAYQHSEGQTFFPKDAAYVAGMLSWDFWTWGAKWETMRSARARARVAAIGVEQARRDVSVEIAQRWADARAARGAVEVARAAVGQSEEAYRVTRVLYDNGRATTTDVLDAQLAQERARLSDTQAAYRYLRARAALERAAGAPLSP
jgi:outer membrane protein